LIFFAGHGAYDEIFEEGYVVASDSKMNDEIKETYISYSNLKTLVGMATSFLVDEKTGLEINKVVFKKKQYYVIKTESGEYISRTLDCILYDKITEENIEVTHFSELKTALLIVSKFLEEDLEEFLD
jgi:hypothetical protein